MHKTKIHHVLQLQHHQHTGKVLHHRHTSYRGLAVILFLAGLMIVGLNILSRAAADTLDVYAVNPAPIPSTGVVITSPVDGYVTYESGVTLSGTCPVITPRVIVVLTDNGQPIGSVACANDYTFSLQTNLSYGLHTFVAQTYTITDDRGPDSNTVRVTYTAAAKPVPTQPVTEPTPPITEPTTQPLSITSERPFIVYGPSRDAIWTGSIHGGAAPYHLTINWGDGSHNTYTVDDSSTQRFRHHYKIIQSYDVVFIVNDAAGQKLTWHTAAVTPYTPPVITSGTTGGSTLNSPGLFGIYGLYLLLLGIFGFFWLGAHPFSYAKVHTPTRTHRKRVATKRVAKKVTRR